MKKDSFRTIPGALFGIFLILVVTFAPPLPAKADPVTAVIGFVVFAVGALAVVDAFSCDINVFWGCPSDKNGGGGGKDKPGPIPPITRPGVPTSSTSSTSGVPTGTDKLCGTKGVNSCGMSGTGFIVGGACNATIPPNSACPVPTITAGTGFYAEPTLVKATNQATLHWNVTQATSCAVSGGGLLLSNLGITGSTQTSPITQKTVFTLTCINGAGGPSSSANATVNLVPTFKEI